MRGAAFVNAGGDGGNVIELELSQQNTESGAVNEGKMQCGACGSAQGFGRKRAGGAGLAGGGGDGSGSAEGSGGAKNCSDIAGILDSGENDEKRSERSGRSGEEIFELRLPRNDESGDALRVFCVGDAFEEAVGGVKDREGKFGAIDERSEFGVMALAGFAEED